MTELDDLRARLQVLEDIEAIHTLRMNYHYFITGLSALRVQRKTGHASGSNAG